jgi:hypothetical protein
MNPATVPSTRAARLHRMRHLNSSRWSRKGISPFDLEALIGSKSEE